MFAGIGVVLFIIGLAVTVKFEDRAFSAFRATSSGEANKQREIVAFLKEYRRAEGREAKWRITNRQTEYWQARQKKIGWAWSSIALLVAGVALQFVF